MKRYRNLLWAFLFPLGAIIGGCSSGHGVGKSGHDGGVGGEGTAGGGGGPALSGLFNNDGGLVQNDAGTVCNLGVTCATMDAGCGPIGDGCGGTIQCGTCASGMSCGGGGIPSVCGTGCVPTTCGDAGATCGSIGDGCGGSLSCGSCADPTTTCRGIPPTCLPIAEPDGGPVICTPLTCDSIGATCGLTGDGCGGTLDCGGGDGGLCPDGDQVCVGNPPKCETPIQAGICHPAACPTANASCGPTGDGCGDTLNCGQCTSNTICSGIPATCTGLSNLALPDGGPVCQGLTCADFDAGCGQIADGCGNTVPCSNAATGTNACPTNQTCGGGGTLFQCGAPTVQCNTPTGQRLTCLDLPGVDGGAPIVNCGQVSDGCGGLLNCGACPNNAVCGGSTPATGDSPMIPGVPNQCPAPPACTGLCLQQTTCTGPGCTQSACDGGADTIVTGIVYAPGHADQADGGNPWGAPDPLNNVLVYIPNGTVAAFYSTVSCSQCQSEVTGHPLMTTTTPDVPMSGPPAGVSGVPAGDQLYVPGSFTLHNAPVGTDIPLVIQTGRWRRQFIIPEVQACTTNTIDVTNLQAGPLAATGGASTPIDPSEQYPVRLPRTQNEGDIPHMALSTGSVDALECVLRKIGVADSEFTDSSGTGRVHLYTGVVSAPGGNGAAPGASAPGGNTQTEDVLLGTTNAGTITNYDQVLFACQGAANEKPANQRLALTNYANAGGRVYATHYNYHWIYDNPTTTTGWATTGNWAVGGKNPAASGNGVINFQTAAATGQAAGSAAAVARVLGLANWLAEVSVTPTFGSILLNVLRNDVHGAIVPPGVDFIDLQNDPVSPLITMHYTFDTPIPTTAAPTPSSVGVSSSTTSTSRMRATTRQRASYFHPSARTPA